MGCRRKELKKLKIPYYPDNEEDKGHFEINTIEEKIVSDYTGYNFDRIENLDLIEYWVFLRDAVIYNYMQTEKGQEYLENCWRMEQTAPDRESLRKKMNK